MEKSPAVYVLASRRNGTLYVGMTSDDVGRISEHKQGLIEGFTKGYNVRQTVYVEFHDDMNVAIEREKKLKRRRRHAR